MKITCERDKLLAAFQIAAPVAPSRSPKPILQGVKLEASEAGVTLLATDLEIGIRVAVEGVDVHAPGSVVLPLGRFGMILRESSDSAIRIESDDKGTLVRGERSEFRLNSENPAEFPTVADGAGEKAYHELPARQLREIIRRTAFATDSESSRYALGGVLIELADDKITAVGTDGRRLAKVEGPARAQGGHKTGDQTTIIPTKAMTLIERSLADNDGEVQLVARPNEVLVKSSRVTIYTRLVEGRFPRWRDVFPSRTGAQKIECVVGPLLAAVKQAAIVTSDDSRGVDFSFNEGKVLLSGRSADAGQSRVEFPIAYDGPAIGITLDPRYFADFLRVLDPAKSFTLELKDAESAAVCFTDDGYGYVIMPLARDR
ncbi:MAG: DNA polymerase III subunit beta [Pirellulales bacterium]